MAILGLTFKAGTDDLREAPSLTIIPQLANAGLQVKAYDPKVHSVPQGQLDDIQICSSIEKCLDSVDLAVILTEWDEFATLNWAELGNRMSAKKIIDLRNILDKSDQTLTDFSIKFLGRAS